MDSVAPFAASYRDRCAAAAAWKSQGGKVVGYLCDNIPDELISAAGFFPLRVSGSPDVGSEQVRHKVDRLYRSEVTVRPAFVTSMLERLLDGTYDLLDHLIIPHNRDSIQAIFRQLLDAAENDPSIHIPELHYLDKAWSPYASAEAYNRDRISELRGVLERWSGAAISDQALATAVEAADGHRRLLADAAALRIAPQPRLSGEEMLQIIGSSLFMLRSDHARILRDLLDVAAMLPFRPGPRLYLGGSPQDHLRIYSAIESLGATIVAEDHCWGSRVFDFTPRATGDAMLDLSARFHHQPACSILFPISEGRKACARRAAVANVDAAIFYVHDEDWTQAWETPGQAQALIAQGVPVLTLYQQSYDLGDTEALKGEVAAFLADLPQ